MSVRSGPCSWPLAHCGESAEQCTALAALTPGTAQVITDAATSYLWNWTGRRLGLCTIALRPCREQCRQQFTTYRGRGGLHSNLPWFEGSSFLNPALIGGQWFNLGCGGACGTDPCSCSYVPELRLPGPIDHIVEIRINGTVLAPTSYRVDNNGWVVRTDGGDWPFCMPGGTLVLTRRGHVPIEQVVVGDEVVTHLGRWRKVTASRMTGIRETVTVNARGPVTATADHRIWAREMAKVGNRRKFSEPEWVPAGSLVGQYLALASAIPDQAVRLPEGWQEAPDGFWEFIGFWLGDGWATEAGRVRIAVKKERKVKYLSQLTEGWGWNHTTDTSGDHRFGVTDHALAEFLRAEFGVGAHGKRVPAWILGAPVEVRESFLAGMLNSDGCAMRSDEFRITTTSKSVAIGFKVLLTSLALEAAVYQHKQGHWQIVWRPLKSIKSQSISDERANWVRVRSVVDNPVAVPVYDLTVEDDHSFIADGVIVHNCQNMKLDPLTDNDTFLVTYAQGVPVPAGGQLAAGVLACQMAKAACGNGTCELPQRIQTLTRQGVTVGFLDNFTEVYRSGATGLFLVDSWVASIRGTRGATGMRATSPDVRGRRRTTS